MKEMDNIEYELSHFPHFVQDSILTTTVSRCKAILQRINSEREIVKESEEERVRNENFISFLHFRLKETEKGLEINSSTCGQFPNNINAMINSVYMNLHTGHEFTGNKAIKSLKELLKRDNYNDLLATAQAEQAYCLSRIAPEVYMTAIDLFEKAIGHNSQNYLWKFGCALTYKRCLGIPKCMASMTPEKIKKFIESSIKYHQDIASNSQEEKLRTRSLVLLGAWRVSIDNPVYPVTLEIVEKLQLSDFFQLDPEECFRRALKVKVVQRDSFVLARCGKFLCRLETDDYDSRLQECYKLLVEAYRIFPSAYTCDSLSKVLIEMVDQGISPSEPTTQVREQGSETSSDGRPDGSPECDGLTVNSLHISEVEANEVEATSVRAFGYRPSIFRSKSQHERRFKKVINSPDIVDMLHHDNPLVNLAVEYLEESVDLTNSTNKHAMHSLGLLHRRMAKHASAKTYFRKIISDKDSSYYEKTNAYEQLGFCLRDQSLDPKCSPDEKAEYSKESRLMLTQSIEQLAMLVARISTMSNEDISHWNAFPTLKSILLEDPENMDNIREIAKLNKLIGNHKESLVFYEQLQQKSDDPTVPVQMIMEYIHLRDFNNAKTCLRLLLCTKEGRLMIEKEPLLVYQVYLGNVKHLLEQPRPEEDVDESGNTIKDCCRSLFEYKFKRSEENKKTWDVFIIDDEDKSTESKTATIYSWLKNSCGLAVTFNDYDAFGSVEVFVYKCKCLANSRCLLVVLGGKPSRRVNTLVDIVQSNQSNQSNQRPSVIVPVQTSTDQLPKNLAGNQGLHLSEDSNFNLHCLMLLLGLNKEDFSKIIF